MNLSASSCDSSDWRITKKKEDNFPFELTEDSEFPCILPASANWYCSSILSCLNGYCAVGGKNAVFIFNLRKSPPVCEWDHLAATAINTKVTAVSLMQSDISDDNVRFVAAGMEDGLMRVLDIKTKTVYKEHRKHKVKVTAISWTPLICKSFWAGDEKGNLSIWNFCENAVEIWCPIPTQIVSLEMCPTEVKYVAVGYYNGNILLGDTEKKEAIRILKSHIDEVCSLSWCPLPANSARFASGSKDRTLRIWDLQSDKPLNTFNLPRKLPGQKKEDMSKAKSYHSILWLNESQILSGYPSGDMLLWDIKHNGKWNIIKNAHSRTIFKICMDHFTNQFVSVSMDRQLAVWNSASLTPVHVIPSFAGFIYSISITPLDPHKIVIGVGDNTVRIWSTSSHSSRYQSSHFWQGIKTKVLVVAFHPSKEGIFGFGTDDGHVGCGSTLSHKSDISASHHKKSVYSLSWGPYCSTKEVNGDVVKVNCLFSVGGEGAILMHQLGCFNQDATDISKMIRTVNEMKVLPLRSEITWRVDMNYVAIGNEDGSIDIFMSCKLIHVCRINVHKKMVNCLAWHHDYSSQDLGEDFSCWIASGSNEDCVCVHDLKTVLHTHITSATDDVNVTIISAPLQQFNGHNGRITRVAWSPHCNGLLASSSYDGSVQIWDVKNNAAICNFRGHIGRVQTVFWSYVDRDIVLSGGEDFTLRRWKVSDQTHKLPPAARKVKSKTKRNRTKEEQKTQNIQNIATDKPHVELLGEAVGAIQQKESIKQLMVGYDEEVVHEISVNVIADKKDSDRKKKKLKSLLKKASVADSKKKEARQEDCIKLAEYLKAESGGRGLGKDVIGIFPGENDDVNFGFYCTRQDAFKMLQSECSGHRENGSLDQVIQLQVWQNNIGELLNNCAEEKTLNDTLVALSPLGGYDMWKATILAYAEQLESKRNFHSAVVYYLALGDVYKAIDVFKSNGMFKEALVLAKVQLSNKDPLINELYLLWAKKLSDETNYENAAHCYLAAGFVEDAITVLAKRADSSSLLAAIKIAGVYNMDDRASRYADQCSELLLREAKWNTCEELMAKFDCIKTKHFQVIVSENLVDSLKYSDLVVSSYVTENHENHRLYSTQHFPSPEYLRGVDPLSFQPSFVRKVLSALASTFNISTETVVGFPCCSDESLQLVSHAASLQNGSTNEILHAVSANILVGIIYLLKHDCYNCFKVWLKAFDKLMHCGHHTSLAALFYCLFPRADISFDQLVNLFGSDEMEVPVKQCFTSFIAYNYVGMLHTKWWKMAMKRNSMDDIISILKEQNDEKINKQKFDENAHKVVLCSVEEGDCFSFVSFLSSVLLSETHAMFSITQSKLKKMNERILELDIKKRLTEHSSSRRKDKQQLVRNIPDEIQAHNVPEKIRVHNVPDEIRECLDDIINQAVLKFLDENNKNAIEKVMRSGSSEELLAMKEIVVQQLELFPDYIKELPFPQPTDTIMILLCVCSLVPPSDRRIIELARNIREWGINNGIYQQKSSYLEKLLQQL